MAQAQKVQTTIEDKREIDKWMCELDCAIDCLGDRISLLGSRLETVRYIPTETTPVEAQLREATKTNLGSDIANSTYKVWALRDGINDLIDQLEL